MSSRVFAPVWCVRGESSKGLRLGSSTSWAQGPVVIHTEGMRDDDGCIDELATKKYQHLEY